MREQASKQSIEVKSDRRSEELRGNGRSLVLKAFDEATLDGDAFDGEQSEAQAIRQYNANLAEQIEREGSSINYN